MAQKYLMSPQEKFVNCHSYQTADKIILRLYLIIVKLGSWSPINTTNFSKLAEFIYIFTFL